jgi:hypothetical protein
MMEQERCRTAEACAITGLDARTLQEKAASGAIPGARKLFGRWTFDIAALRRLGRAVPVKGKGPGWPKTSIAGTASAGRASRSPASNIEKAYERALKESRSGG